MTDDAAGPAAPEVSAVAEWPPILNQLNRSKPWLTVKDVARMLDLSKMTIYRMIEDNEIPHHRVGRSIRVAPDDLVAYLARSRREAVIE